MNRENRWAAKWVARVGWNALAGGALVGIVGAFCIGAAGALVGAVYARHMGATFLDGARVGGYVGVILGAMCGVIGVLIFGVAAFRSAPGRLFAPFLQLRGRVALGQFLGTVDALSFFFAVEWAKSQLQNQSFGQGIAEDLKWIQWGAPALMVCGAIAGALSKRDSV